MFKKNVLIIKKIKENKNKIDKKIKKIENKNKIYHYTFLLIAWIKAVILF